MAHRINRYFDPTEIKNDLNTPRIKFNWGYHDGATEHERGRGRLVTNDTKMTPGKTISRKAQPFYAQGYEAGRDASIRGEYYNNSEDAWQDFLNQTTREEFLYICRRELEGYFQSWERLFRKRDDRRNMNARQRQEVYDRLIRTIGG